MAESPPGYCFDGQDHPGIQPVLGGGAAGGLACEPQLEHSAQQPIAE
jgi:hypothetical protein